VENERTLEKWQENMNAFYLLQTIVPLPLVAQESGFPLRILDSAFISRFGISVRDVFGCK
jgi:hypothetical protein